MSRFAADFLPTCQREWDQVRAALLEQTEWRCEYCECELSWKGSEIEHMIPRARGGTDHFVNLTISCKSCNCSKRAKTYCEFVDGVPA